MRSQAATPRGPKPSTELPEWVANHESDVITDAEKVAIPEFFCGRPVKTPERYLAIRRHLLALWDEYKPNEYLKKTSCLGFKVRWTLHPSLLASPSPSIPPSSLPSFPLSFSLLENVFSSSAHARTFTSLSRACVSIPRTESRIGKVSLDYERFSIALGLASDARQ